MGPVVYVWGNGKSRRLALAVALLTFAAPPWAVGAERNLTQVVYDYAVTGYCGALTPGVEDGFRRELAAITARGGIDEESARRQRLRGWIAADREWSNRGLGGQRAWCREEGIPAARHFQAISEGSQQP